MLLTRQIENKKDIKPVAVKKKKKNIFSFLFTPIASSKDKDYFFENLITLLSAGIDISTVLESLKKDSKSKSILGLINSIETDIKNGSPLWKSIQDVKLVEPHLINVIRIGEESGELIENLRIVLAQQQRDREFSSKLRSASLYPIFIAVLMLVVGLGVGVFILPRLSTVYSSLKVELPFTTKLLINIGTFLGQYGIIAVPAFVIILITIFYVLFINKKTKFLGQAILLRTPVVKNIIKELEISRLGFLLGTLLQSGFPINDAFQLLEDSTEVRLFQKLYHHISTQISQGYTIKSALDTFKQTDRIFPSYTIQMISSAELTGDLPATMERIGNIYLKKNEATTKDLTVLLEPVLLIIVWLGVAFIAFSIILPIYGLVGNLTDIASQSPATINSNELQNPEGTVDIPAPEPAPVPVPDPTPAVVPTLEIQDTGSSYLNVRDGVGGTIIAQAFPGERYEYLQTLSGWYQIKLNDGTLGWVSGDYIKIIN